MNVNAARDTVVVIGANRGIGLEFTKQYLQAGCDVIGTFRDNNTLGDLHALQKQYPGALSLRHLELKDLTSIESFTKTVTKVNLLILNAGIKGYSKAGARPIENTPQEMQEAYAVNTIGPDHVIRMLYPVLSKQEDACVVYMSTLVAEPTDNGSGGYHPYRASKLAMNGNMWNWCIDLMRDWCAQNSAPLFSKAPCAFSICPGWVRTKMGGENARLSPQESVSRMRTVIEYVRKTKECNALYTHDRKKPVTYPVTDDLKRIRKSIPKFKKTSNYR